MRKSFKTSRLALLLAVVIALPIVGFVVHGGSALRGITWGMNFGSWRPCSLELSVMKRFCQADKADLTISVGAYDPDARLASSNTLAFDHYFIQWNNLNIPALRADLQASAQRDRWPMITIEPWPLNDGTHTGSSLFRDVTAGVYDPEIDAVCQSIQQYQKPVFVRWAQEMENVTGRYPWASLDAQGYIASYQHVVTRCRSTTMNVFYVWSPAGNKNLSYYWPGRQYVDYVGVSVFSLPQFEEDTYGHVRTFDELFSEKYDLVKVYDRPVIIAELGVTGGATHQWFWLQDAIRSFQRYPLLKSAVYFNARDSKGAWGPKYGTPDWHIDPAALQAK